MPADSGGQFLLKAAVFYPIFAHRSSVYTHFDLGMTAL
jgi:hypothetical protein